MSHLSVNGNWNKDIDESQRKTILIEKKIILELKCESTQTFNSWIKMGELTKDAQKEKTGEEN